MRMITSCLECRRRKLKCDKKAPCENCQKFTRECVYLGSKLDEASQLRLTEIKEKVGSLERALERDVAKSTTSRMGKQGSFVVDDIDYGYAEDLEIWPADMIGVDSTLDNVPQGTEDILDLGVQIGRMRLTDRVGGLSRPRLAEEVCLMTPFSIAPTFQFSFSNTCFGKFPVCPEPQFLSIIPRHRAAVSGASNLAGLQIAVGVPDQIAAELTVGMPGINAVGGRAMGLPSGRPPDGSIPDFMQPGATFIAPSTSFVFGQTVNPGPALDGLLPSRDAADQLMTRYFQAVHPVARCVHQPSFEALYAVFWDEICTSFEPRPSTQAVMFAAMLSAAVSLDPALIMQQFGADRTQLIDRLKLGVETALCKASFLRSTRFETLQGLVMYLVRIKAHHCEGCMLIANSPPDSIVQSRNI